MPLNSSPRISREVSATENDSGSEKGVFWKRGLFRKAHFLEILENLEILEILEKFREIFRDSRDSASEKTPFVMTPLSGPE